MTHINKAPLILDIDIIISDNQWEEKQLLIEQKIQSITQEVLEAMGLAKIVKNIELSVNLCNAQYIKDLNYKYRGFNKATNVLSFPNEEIDPLDFTKLNIHNDYIMLGDIIICYEVIEQEAMEQNKNFIDHFTHLLIHGILHLLGYDHEEQHEAEQMESLEITLLEKF